MMHFFLLFSSLLFSSVGTEKWGSFIGFWRSLDAQSGQWNFTAEIYEKKGKLYARVVELPENATLKKCEKCKPPLKNQALLGMDIIWELEFKEGMLENGKILDPNTGSIYDCYLWIGQEGELHVRGYFKLKAFGKTQIWYPLKTGS